ncbi:DDE family transposase [Palleronia aestuarii]|uniref:DDE family transposase n=1 Tax=Palleronia aestuarii TaxID=568105 RepID=A0A2W7NIJ5_9RHOB|nr:DDE family transposase [Palleronia aestuarii]
MPNGIKVRGEGEWHARKHGGAKRRVWRKVRLAVDEATVEVRAVEITGSGIGDAPFVGVSIHWIDPCSSPLPGLLSQIPAGEPIASVTADGAYDGRACRDAIASRGAEAIIPPRRDAQPWKKDSLGAAPRNEALRAIKRFGRTLWRRWSGYHRRSRVETKMNCMKLLRQRLAARDFDRQTAELHVRIAILNRFTSLGMALSGCFAASDKVPPATAHADRSIVQAAQMWNASCLAWW